MGGYQVKERFIKIKHIEEKMEETVCIPREEYERLKRYELVVEIIEETIHQPELSEEIKEELAEAREVPDSELLDHEEVKRRYGVE